MVAEKKDNQKEKKLENSNSYSNLAHHLNQCNAPTIVSPNATTEIENSKQHFQIQKSLRTQLSPKLHNFTQLNPQIPKTDNEKQQKKMKSKQRNKSQHDFEIPHIRQSLAPAQNQVNCLGNSDRQRLNQQ